MTRSATHAIEVRKKCFIPSSGNLISTIMTNREIFRVLRRCGYSRVDIDTDRKVAKTFYTYRGGLHINGTENLSFHIVPPQDSLGLGRFAICATRNGESSQLGTDHAPFFFRRLFAFLKGERKEKEIIDEIIYKADSHENGTI